MTDEATPQALDASTPEEEEKSRSREVARLKREISSLQQTVEYKLQCGYVSVSQLRQHRSDPATAVDPATRVCTVQDQVEFLSGLSLRTIIDLKYALPRVAAGWQVTDMTGGRVIRASRTDHSPNGAEVAVITMSRCHPIEWDVCVAGKTLPWVVNIPDNTDDNGRRIAQRVADDELRRLGFVLLEPTP